MTKLSELYDLMSKFEPSQDSAERHRQEQLLTDCLSAENADAFGRALGQCKSLFVPDHVGGIFSNNGADLLFEASQAYEEGDDARKMKGVISYVTSSLALERHLHAIDAHHPSAVDKSMVHDLDVAASKLKQLIALTPERTPDLVAELIDDDAPQPNPKTLNERTEGFKEKARACNSKLLEMVDVHRNAIKGYRDAERAPITQLEPVLALRTRQEEHERLQADLAKAQEHVTLIDSVINLMTISDTQRAEISKVEAVKKEAKLAVIQLEIRCASELAEVPLLKLKHIKDYFDEIPVVTPEDRQDFKKEADNLFSAVQAQIDTATGQIEQAKNRLAEGAVLTSADNDRIAALDRQLAEAKAHHAAITKRLAKKGNAYMALNDSLDRLFTVELLKKSTPAGQDPVKVGLPRAEAEDLMVRQELDLPVIYQRVQLDPGDVIRSVALFQGGAGILVQDHTGTVTDKTPPGTKAQLLPQDQAVLALKQAKMLMDNYDPTKGDIVIRGGATNVEQAKRVYAAMLYLQRENPHFQTIDIKSYVPGCEVQDSFFRSNDAMKDNFIRDHFETALKGPEPDKLLATEVANTAREVGTHVGSMAERTQLMRSELKDAIKQQKSQSEQNKIVDKHTPKEGQKMDIYSNPYPSK